MKRDVYQPPKKMKDTAVGFHNLLDGDKVKTAASTKRGNARSVTLRASEQAARKRPFLALG